MTEINEDLERRRTRSSCPVHGLAVDDEGQCVLCRRTERPAQKRLPLLPVVGVLAGVLFAALGAYGVVKYAGCDSETVVAVAESVPATEPPAEPRKTRPRGRRGRAPRPAWMSERPAPQGDSGEPAPNEAEEAEETSSPTTTRDLEQEKREAIERAREREVAIREEMRKVQIKVYMTTWCPVCTKARRWLTANGYRFTEYDVERSPDARRTQQRLNPKGGVPTMDIEGTVLTGFSAQAIERALRSRAERKVRM